MHTYESEIFSRKTFRAIIYIHIHIYIKNSENDISYRGNKTW